MIENIKEIFDYVIIRYGLVSIFNYLSFLLLLNLIEFNNYFQKNMSSIDIVVKDSNSRASSPVNPSSSSFCWRMDYYFDQLPGWMRVTLSSSIRWYIVLSDIYSENGLLFVIIKFSAVKLLRSNHRKQAYDSSSTTISNSANDYYQC